MAEEQSRLFYQFRKLENIFKYKELENQEIYFASPEELNDPMEAHHNIIFNGDKILWHNLFKHYLMCLYRSIVLTKYNIEDQTIYIDLDNNSFISGFEKDFFSILYNYYHNIIDKYVDSIMKNSSIITKSQLLSYLIHIDHYTKHFIFEFLDASKEQRMPKIIANFVDIYPEFMQNSLQNQIKTKGEDLSNSIIYDLQSNSYYNGCIYNNIDPYNSYKYINLVSFAYRYMQQLEKLFIPYTYMSSFTNNIYNSAIWSHYSDSHKGICLIFKSDNNKIKLHNSFTNHKKIFNFEKVIYKNTYEDIEFFSNINNTTKDNIITNWYTDYFNHSKISNLTEKFINKTIKDKKIYMNAIKKNVLTKLDNWNYEEEYKLILFNDHQKLQKEERLFKYDFNNLFGIIFGMHTHLKDKEYVLNILKAKCRKYNRKDFVIHDCIFNINNKNISFITTGLPLL